MRDILALAAIVAPCLAAGCGSPAPPAVPPATFDLLAWEYPGARPVARMDPVLAATGKVGAEEIASGPREATRVRPPALYAYDSPDPLEAVYAFYGRKLGLDPEFQPFAVAFVDEKLTTGTRLSYPGSGSFPTLRASYTGLNGRQEVRTATLVGPGDPGTSVVVILTRGKAEGYTSIELVVTPGPGR